MDLCDIQVVRALLARHGFRFSKSMGQNFLISGWVPQEIALPSGADDGCGVLEIGPGIGPLTRQLAKRAGKVVALELDKTLMPILDETLAGCPNVEVIYGAATKLDCATIARERFGDLTPMVCANLPYNITTPILTQLLKAQAFSCITVMIQKEVAQRICAAPGSADYGAFTLLCLYSAACELLFEVPPSCFVPAPKVTSAVVRMTRLARPAVQVEDEGLLFRVIRAAFAQRRKTLLNALGAAFPALSKDALREAIVSCGFSESVRGEKLSLEELARLSERIGGII